MKTPTMAIAPPTSIDGSSGRGDRGRGTGGEFVGSHQRLLCRFDDDQLGHQLHRIGDRQHSTAGGDTHEHGYRGDARRTRHLGRDSLTPGRSSGAIAR